MRTVASSLLVVLASIGSLGAGCGRDDAAPTPASTLEGAITVSAATSLKAAFTEIGDDFTTANPDVEVRFTFGASSALATQIREGAPSDLFASADEANMAELLTDEDLIAGEPEVFARNELVIITKPGNPAGITTLADLADAGVVALCGEEVPCGAYAAQALEASGVSIPESSVTRGQNVGATLTAVAEGDAVAGVVYVTDAEGAGETVDTVAIPAEHDVVATYPIGVLTAAPNGEVAEAFVAYVLGDEGRAVLEEHGFLPPS